MKDPTALLGAGGVLASLSIAQLNEYVGLVGGLLTVVYLVSQIVLLWSKKK